MFSKFELLKMQIKHHVLGAGTRKYLAISKTLSQQLNGPFSRKAEHFPNSLNLKLG